jgi:hypothetical protein
MEKKYELLINGTKYVLTFIPDSIEPGRDAETGMAHLVMGDAVVGDYPYNELSFVKNPFHLPTRG